jgi:hypothetical protein
MKIKLLVAVLLIATAAFAQEKSTKIYGSFATEMIFSFAQIDQDGNDQGNIVRWAPAINPQSMLNIDFGNIVGLYTGLAIRNVGFIYEDPVDVDNAKYKYRTYNLGIPVGIKLGKLDKMLIFGGYEIEFPFVYKEKKFVNEEKVEKDVIWFSDRVEPVQHSVMAGIQFPYGATLKFKYYLTNFHNQDFELTENGIKSYPYSKFSANVFYISLAWNLFTNWKDYEPGSMNKTSEIR